MTYEAREESRSGGLPVFLYLFRYDPAPGCYYAFTTAERPVSMFVNEDIGDVLFEPAPVTHGNITASGATDKSTVEVKMPYDIGIAAKFPRWPPSKVISLLIFDGHVGEDEFKLLWTGRTLSWKLNGFEAIYSCETSSTSMQRTGLRENWQLQCNYALYDPETCKAERQLFNAAVTVVQGALVSVSGSWDGEAPKFATGIAEWTCPDGRTEYRTIIDFSANLLTLSGRATDLVPGDTIVLSWGCTHTYDAPDDPNPLGCGLHANRANFGGDPFIPDDNPTGTVNIYD